MNTTTTKPLILAGALTFTVSLAVMGCFGSKHGAAKGDLFVSNEELQTYALPYSNAYLILGGTPHETKMVSDKTSSKVSFTLSAHGTALDEENYSFDSKAFNYLGNKSYGEFSPGISILKFPFNVGDSWEWSGTYLFGGKDRAASANVSTDAEKLNTVAGEFNAVKVTVALEIESGGMSPVKQDLVFWFAPNRGLVRREFEYSGTREPMPPETASARQ